MFRVFWGVCALGLARYFAKSSRHPKENHSGERPPSPERPLYEGTFPAGPAAAVQREDLDATTFLKIFFLLQEKYMFVCVIQKISFFICSRCLCLAFFNGAALDSKLRNEVDIS